MVLAGLALVWVGNSAGIVSSNDGSHVALARALAVHGRTAIEDDKALTLGVDMAERDGHAYSDRPPGTAFAFLAGAWLGDRGDPRMRANAIAQARAGEPVDPLPGPEVYVLTYSARSPTGPPLVDRIATSIASNLHAACVGLLGLLFVARLSRRAGVDEPGVVFVLATVGAATLWGPYSTALFAHVSAATGVAGFLLGVAWLADRPLVAGDRRAAVAAAATGLAGAWAISCDYLLLLAIVPIAGLGIGWPRWPWVLVGTSPIVAATLAYHDAAFGGPFAVGYDYQTNFAFARERGSTFSGSLFDGLWTLWGAGRGAGVLVQSPITMVGVAAAVGFVAAPSLRARLAPSTHEWLRAAAIGLGIWALALALHRTPWGGGTEDHRYLVPLLPLVAVGLGLAFTHAPTWLRVGLTAIALVSAVLVWRHFLGWHEVDPFARAGLGAAAATVTLLIAVLVSALLDRRAKP